MKTALEYGLMGCETMMKNIKAADLPPVGRWHYHQGVFLSGMEHIYELCGDKRLAQYIKDYVDSRILPDGSIDFYSDELLDDIQPGILLYRLIDETGEERYKKALDTLIGHMRDWPCTPEGGYWHRKSGPGMNEMWLDSLYMGSPIQAMYAEKYNNPKMFDALVRQVVLMKDNMQDKNNGLMLHAWDYNKRAPWCDPSNGLAPEAWGRAMGWYVAAILDIYERMPENHPSRETLAEIEREVIEAVAGYRDEATHMWYQVVNMTNMWDNWTETSCSCLFTYAMAKGVRLGILDKKYLDMAKESFEGIITNGISISDEDLFVERVCVGTGVGTYNHYINRPTVANDLHGMGVFLLMCAELSRNGI
ncbi:MAG: glycoside hydrolase family 88 protein [Oscillospiraceae bacterium]|nr:glycoside hydrolase family 88 protein [Oscillospiraceae bacterium]